MRGMAARIGYRSVFVISQSLAWLSSQILRLCFAPEMHRPPGVFDRGPAFAPGASAGKPGRGLILAPTHQSVLDPFLIMSALRYRQWRMLAPIRTLGDFAPGVIYLQRQSGAAIVPMAVWMSQGTLELYERARRRGEHGR